MASAYVPGGANRELSLRSMSLNTPILDAPICHHQRLGQILVYCICWTPFEYWSHMHTGHPVCILGFIKSSMQTGHAEMPNMHTGLHESPICILDTPFGIWAMPVCILCFFLQNREIPCTKWANMHTGHVHCAYWTSDLKPHVQNGPICILDTPFVSQRWYLLSLLHYAQHPRRPAVCWGGR